MTARFRSWYSSAAHIRAATRSFAGTFLAIVFTCTAITVSAQTELTFADFNAQGLFNNFSGDSGAFVHRQSRIDGYPDTRVFRGTNGASLRLEYRVDSGFCGLWMSLVGKASYPEHTLDFTDIHGALRSSTGNPARVENVSVTKFSFWARGNGSGDFNHQVKIELKNPQTLVADALFTIPNSTNWVRYEFPLTGITNDLTRMKEVIFVIEDWRNRHTNGHLYLDDLAFTIDEPPFDPAQWENDAMLDVISHRSFSYFLRFTDSLGFALDRSTFSDMVSVGTIGFQLTAYCIGHQRGWADPKELETRVTTILKNLENIPMGPDPGTACGGNRGFYYHFLKANSGRRKDSRVELSLYDTMLLMFGVLTCREYFPDNPEIQRLSRVLFDRVEWNWFVDKSNGPNRNQFRLAWIPDDTPDGKFFGHVDGQTDEALMVDVLALGSTTFPVDFSTYTSRVRVFGAYPDSSDDKIMVTWGGSMFNYFFASCWLDFASRGFDLHPTMPQDIWNNDLRAIIANRQFCIDHASRRLAAGNGRFATYSEKAWGLTACDNVVQYVPGRAGEYFAFGSLPSEENIRFQTRPLHAGTIAVYGAGSAINYTPAESIEALRFYLTVPSLWNSLSGLGDAFSLDPHSVDPPYDRNGNPTIRPASYLNGPWVNNMSMGINVGPMLLAIENHRTGSIWKLTARNPEIARGLDAIFGLGSPALTSVTINENSNPGKTVTIKWEPDNRASSYNVYGSTDKETWMLLKDGIRDTEWTEHLGEGPERFYHIKAVR